MFRRILMMVLCAAFALAGGLAETEETDSPEKITLPEKIRGYVLVTAGGQTGWLPLPEEGEYDFPIVQTQPDGTTMQNILHLTPEGVAMASATCDNQDCVGQGEVTLANREERILSNMIICLPHQVLVELMTPEEMQSLLAGAPITESRE